jgi:Putative adhesin
MQQHEPSPSDPAGNTTGKETPNSGSREQSRLQIYQAIFGARDVPSWLAKLFASAPWFPPARRNPGRWAVASTVALCILAVFFATRPSTSPPQQVAPDTRVFSVGGPPKLLFTHAIGSVHIAPGADGQVRIQELRNGITDSIGIRYSQRGDTITVIVDIPTGLYLDTWVDFNVSVPQGTGLSVSAATGTLTVKGLSGQTSLVDTDGSIWASGLSGSTVLESQSGSINTDHLSGQLTAATGNGTITTSATHLSGRCSVQAQSGTINFHGSLDRSGDFEFRDSNGAIGITLPRDSAFHLAARTAGGSLNTEFPNIIRSHVREGVDATGNVGARPWPRLTIQTASGSIDLHQENAQR